MSDLLNIPTNFPLCILAKWAFYPLPACSLRAINSPCENFLLLPILLARYHEGDIIILKQCTREQCAVCSYVGYSV